MTAAGEDRGPSQSKRAGSRKRKKTEEIKEKRVKKKERRNKMDMGMMGQTCMRRTERGEGCVERALS
jgi:hypothetical protein